MPVRSQLFTGRDPRLHPFASDSIWNLGISTDATIETAQTSTITAGLHVLSGGSEITASFNQDQYSHPIYNATFDDPLIPATGVTAGQSWTPSDRLPPGGTHLHHFPKGVKAAGGADGHLHVIDPGGYHCYEAIGMDTKSVDADGNTTSFTYTRTAVVDLYGNGIGPQNGCRAYGGPAIGGLIRAWEVDVNHPRYTGRIDHMIAGALDGSQLFKNAAVPSGSTSYNSSGNAVSQATGFTNSTNIGYVWPATEQDFNWYTNYKGVIPMGQLFTMNSATPDPSLSTWGQMLWTTIWEFGWLVTDQTVGNMVLGYVEPQAPATFRLAITPTERDVIRDNMRAVTNNTSTTPNGGVVGSGRRPAHPVAAITR